MTAMPRLHPESSLQQEGDGGKSSGVDGTLIVSSITRSRQMTLIYTVNTEKKQKTNHIPGGAHGNMTYLESRSMTGANKAKSNKATYLQNHSFQKGFLEAGAFVIPDCYCCFLSTPFCHIQFISVLFV